MRKIKNLKKLIYFLKRKYNQPIGGEQTISISRRLIWLLSVKQWLGRMWCIVWCLSCWHIAQSRCATSCTNRPRRRFIYSLTTCCAPCGWGSSSRSWTVCIGLGARVYTANFSISIAPVPSCDKRWLTTATRATYAPSPTASAAPSASRNEHPPAPPTKGKIGKSSSPWLGAWRAKNGRMWFCAQ